MLPPGGLDGNGGRGGNGEAPGLHPATALKRFREPIPTMDTATVWYLTPQCVSPFFLISLLFRFHSVINRVATRAHDLPSFSDDPFGSLAKFARLLIQIIQ